MPRKIIGPEVRIGAVRTELAERLAAELKNGREYGQPFISEQEYRTGKIRVLVIWDAWDGVSLQERSATILPRMRWPRGPLIGTESLSPTV